MADQPRPDASSASATRSRTPLWIALAIAALALLWAWQYFDLGRLLTLESLKNSREALAALVAQRPALSVVVYFAAYVLVAAASLPGAAVLTLAGGALFGFWQGLLVVSFASSIGATLAFLVSRYLLHDMVQARFGDRLKSINEGVKRDGWLYLLTLRLVPVFPFFAVNLLMGLTPMPVARFYLVSQVGMLLGTAVYVNAGTQLATISSLKDVLSPGLLLSFALLGIFPLIAKAIVGMVRRRKVYARFNRPKKFDRNLVVIGAGAGGLVTAYIAAVVKAKVTLVEGHKMGGDCLNYGCVPSKALIRSARQAHQQRQAARLGIVASAPEIDFPRVMARIHEVIARIEPHDSVERYTGLGVEVLTGHARIVSPWAVEVALADGGTQRLSTRHIVVATGAQPLVPPIPGLKDIGCLTSDTVWGLTTLPRRLLVLGGGPIGCELSQAFARLGSQVTQVEVMPRLMGREDAEVAALVQTALQRDGVAVRVNHKALRVEKEGDTKRLIAEHDGQEVAFEFDELLCAVGRSARVAGFGLEELGVVLTERKTIAVDEYLRTNYPNILAVGDVAGPYQFTHFAAHQAWYAAVNALFGQFKKFKADYSVIPWATFTDPEVARVGLSEADAKEKGIAVEVTRYGLDDLDRAIADGSDHGFVKVLTPPGKDKILGVTIVGEHSAELLAEFVLAMRHGLGLNKILGTIHAYPTMVEANKYAAGEWKKAHTPHKLLAWVKRFHDWQRG